MGYKINESSDIYVYCSIWVVNRTFFNGCIVWGRDCVNLLYRQCYGLHKSS
ncbi:hypothetical protein VCSRO184_3664 [Vibrio cholerae]|nr:hypothetical protein VCSRO184_3664 [Vibrio cholerae]